MKYTVKGIVTSKSEIETTKLGTAIRRLHFEQEHTNRPIYPVALGGKIELLENLFNGDVVELEFHISGSADEFKNVIIIDNISKI